MDKKNQYTNSLINESSPYLLQHAHNPVDWKPWGDKALKQAKKEDKLIIISIGYAACHWCHVMEHESFEDTLVAKKMNNSYVSIKIDREERPDIDQIYMDAAQLMTGRGGWPLNVISLPDGRPIFAGTYFPKEDWKKILDYFADIREKDPQKVEEQAEGIMRGLQQMEVPSLSSSTLEFSDKELKVIAQTAIESIDLQYGGRKGSPKFPMPSVQELLLTSNYFYEDSKTQKALKTTLDRMADGGIYDHLGGGFARYSTDDQWIVPHFEKMLYDNGQLISLYSHAFQAFGDYKYEQTVRETISFCQRELLDESGGFYSSLDADSDGEEGKFYVWSKKEIDELLSEEEALVIKKYYGITKSGNFEGHNILVRSTDIETLAKSEKMSTDQLSSILISAKSKLIDHRSNRIRPGLDDKVLTSWNGLMLIGLTDAYEAFLDENYKLQAIQTGNFIRKNQLNKDGRLWRNYKNGKSSINAFLDDYAFTILGFISLYQITFDEEWLFNAKKMLDYVHQHFFDEASSMYHYTSDIDQKLISRKMELSDNVIPASNSAIAEANFLIGTIFYDEPKVVIAKQMVANSLQNIRAYPNYYSNWARLYLLIGKPFAEVAIMGKAFEEKKKELSKPFIPNKVLMGGKKESSLELLKGKLLAETTMIFVCENKSCQMPTEKVEVALKQIRK
ncbi:thioredoxin domain-containing protein [Reichenbachiella versicolor]|uniref:thioredoxin domain-containing protein n=1 Tax=Reichenbachiella versicolor TaxID=1821036 RepID=UPI000D6EA078|nr:thioredoxin domain-containing protein [Reichenbachiella versicolor]